MKIKDRVYGDFEVNDKVLLDLISSKPVQRLKGINQAGASQYAFNDRDVSRYEHSIGVVLLLKQLNAPLEEQVAGLLHDVPHTAFSHVADFVYKNKNHEFHEKFHEKIIKNSEIPKILEKNEFYLERILNEDNFPLLESKIPNLCADRIDYALRDLTARNGYDSKIKYYLDGLTIENNEIIFNNFTVARDFAKEYLKIDYDVWSNPREVALYQILGDAISKGLASGILIESDLFSVDSIVYEKLKNSNNKFIHEKLNFLKPGFEVELSNKKDCDFYSKNKVRYVDPKFKNGNNILRVSDLANGFARQLKEHNDMVENGYYIKIIDFKKN
jgi:HD superfamily phosphohydrolase